MNLLYLDSALIVINKPEGVPVLPDGWEPDAPYLLRMLEQKYGKVWVVHRLDKSTSGVMLFARTAEAHRDLNCQFDHREVEKFYHAIVEGKPTWEEKTCRMPLRVNVGHKHRTIVDHERGKHAETSFKVIRLGQSQGLIQACPKTGRTHQIRIHLASLGYPLLGDALYGATKTGVINRPALHATLLTFTHPVSKQRLTFSADYPQDFALALKRLSL